MLQANNQAMGSPSNRINIHAHYAADGLAAFTPRASRSLSQIGLKTYAIEKFRLVIFRVVLFAVDLGFQFTRIRSWITEKMGGKGEGLEDLLQRQVSVSFWLSLCETRAETSRFFAGHGSQRIRCRVSSTFSHTLCSCTLTWSLSFADSTMLLSLVETTSPRIDFVSIMNMYTLLSLLPLPLQIIAIIFPSLSCSSLVRRDFKAIVSCGATHRHTLLD